MELMLLYASVLRIDTSIVSLEYLQKQDRERREEGQIRHTKTETNFLSN